MAFVPRDKGQFVQASTPHVVPKILGSYLSMDGMVDFDTNYEQEDYPELYAQIGHTYDDSTTGPTQFKTPKLAEWGLPELKEVNFTTTTTVDLYETSMWDNAIVEGVLTEGTKKELITLKIIDDTVDSQVDVQRFAVKSPPTDASFSVAIATGVMQLTISGTGTFDFKYQFRPILTQDQRKFMIRF